jgi:predicted ribosome quality control (RQC) complex YloA/Tae2 family protein
MISITIKEFTLLIGKNQEENDILISTSDDNDTWFHLQNFPSCHGVINIPLEQLDSQTIYQCAIQIKKRTKYKKINNIFVNYCPIHNLKKTKTKGKVFLQNKKCIRKIKV